MNRLGFYFCLALAPLVHFAQAQDIGLLHRVSFRDKGQSYSIQNPEKFLSQAAIDRRERQGIAIAQRDLPLDLQYVQTIETIAQRKVATKSKWINAVSIALTQDQASTIAALPFVRSVNPYRQLREFAPREVPELPLENTKELLQSLDIYYGEAYNQIKMIGAQFLHQAGFGGEGINIGVLDAGFIGVNTYPAFADLRGENRIKGTKDFVADTSFVYHFSFHGTSVLSTMAAVWPGTMVGTAPAANYFLVRTENASKETISEEDNWMAGAEWCDSIGVDIINTSLSYTTFDSAGANHTYSDMDGNTTIIARAADIAAATGMLVVVSAGNYGNSSWQYIGTPADADSVLTVGAVSSEGNYWPFSATGPTSDGRIKPDVAAQGELPFVISAGGVIVKSSGTSFAAPIISGAAACLWQANRSATNLELIDAIRKSASQYNNPDNFRGYGIPNFLLAHNNLNAGNPITPVHAPARMLLGPIPAREFLDVMVCSEVLSEGLMELFDFRGRLCLSRVVELTPVGVSTSRLTFNTDALTPGVYIARFTSDGVEQVQKVLIAE